MNFVLLIIGLVIVIKSADILIDSASKIARYYKISSFIIGITVVAFGTSTPELAVGIISGASHTNQLTLGNIIGSSFSNIALIIGIASIILPLQVKDSVVKKEIPMLIIIEIILGIMVLWDGQLSRIEGLILLVSFIAFMIYISRNKKQSIIIQIDAEGDIDTDGNKNGVPVKTVYNNLKLYLFRLWGLSAISLIGLFIGGKLIVDSSTRIALDFGLSETLIGLTVIALGTTMPELVTSIIAVKKKEPDIVIGNCIGSNIFNILLVLGCSSVISPIKMESNLWLDIGLMLALTILLSLILLWKKHISRFTGILLFAGYFTYFIIKIVISL